MAAEMPRQLAAEAMAAGDAHISLQAVEHTCENQALVVQATRPPADVERLLTALGIRLPSPVVPVTNVARPPDPTVALNSDVVTTRVQVVKVGMGHRRRRPGSLSA